MVFRVFALVFAVLCTCPLMAVTQIEELRACARKVHVCISLRSTSVYHPAHGVDLDDVSFFKGELVQDLLGAIEAKFVRIELCPDNPRFRTISIEDDRGAVVQSIDQEGSYGFGRFFGFHVFFEGWRRFPSFQIPNVVGVVINGCENVPYFGRAACFPDLHKFYVDNTLFAWPLLRNVSQDLSHFVKSLFLWNYQSNKSPLFMHAPPHPNINNMMGMDAQISLANKNDSLFGWRMNVGAFLQLKDAEALDDGVFFLSSAIPSSSQSSNSLDLADEKPGACITLAPSTFEPWKSLSLERDQEFSVLELGEGFRLVQASPSDFVHLKACRGAWSAKLPFEPLEDLSPRFLDNRNLLKIIVSDLVRKRPMESTFELEGLGTIHQTVSARYLWKSNESESGFTDVDPYIREMVSSGDVKELSYFINGLSKREWDEIFPDRLEVFLEWRWSDDEKKTPFFEYRKVLIKPALETPRVEGYEDHHIAETLMTHLAFGEWCQIMNSCGRDKIIWPGKKAKDAASDDAAKAPSDAEPADPVVGGLTGPEAPQFAA